jgi:hypothetical protein
LIVFDGRKRMKVRAASGEATARQETIMTRAITRRDALKTLGAGASAAAVLPFLSDDGLAAFLEIQKANAAPALKVLSAPQYATVEALVEAIIPADERSPGAKEARVADYIDLLLSEGDAALQKQWLDGLAALDAEAAARFDAPFLRLEAAQVYALLDEASRNEPPRREPAAEPSREERPTDVSRAERPADAALNEQDAETQKTPLQAFFLIAKQATIHGYYTSEIGIHKELRYKGNQLLAEFVGCQTVDGKDCPHCGQKAEA